MKKHSKIGNRPGRPAYRTSATFRYRQQLKVKNQKSKSYNLKAKS